ncbi:MAG TPA: hypothetical protein VF302_09300 [Candidatus Limnocylindrales bacterium]
MAWRILRSTGQRATTKTRARRNVQMPDKKKPIEDDVEGHRLAPNKASEDDVEGHNIGVMNPIVARDLIRARERDIQREASRNSLISEAKRALGRKR